MSKVKTYKIHGLDCASCATLLEMGLEDMGISCKCSYPKETLEIDSDCDIKKVEEVIKKSGYNLIR